MLISLRFLLIFALPFVLTAAVAKETARFKIPSNTMALMETYCLTCHDDDTQKGDVRLDALSELPLEDRLDM